MNILRRWLWATKEFFQKAAEPVTNRCIEVTVERETLTMLVRGQQELVQEIEGMPLVKKDEPASRPLESSSARQREKQKSSARNR
jgi:hypothetical protein